MRAFNLKCVIPIKYVLSTSKGDTSETIVKIKIAIELQKKQKFLEKKLTYTIPSVT